MFVVHSGTDAKAYKNFLPIYFPPTYGDLENMILTDDPKTFGDVADDLEDAYIQGTYLEALLGIAMEEAPCNLLTHSVTPFPNFHNRSHAKKIVL